MKIFTAGAMLLLSTTAAHAIGLDRSNQDIDAIFEDDNRVQFSFGSILPQLGGTDAIGATYDNTADDFLQYGASLTYHLNERVTIALIYDQPFGADIRYPNSPAASLLGGTTAILDSNAVTAVARYEFDENWSIHGGISIERLSADIGLGGIAYAARDPSTGAVIGAGLSGYSVALADNTAAGFVIGSAYERPDIALRVALTYRSAITHDFASTEIIGGNTVTGITTVESPQSWNLDFQTGIAEGTLLFGQIRYADYDTTLVSPPAFSVATGGRSLTDIDSDFGYELGIGRRLTDQLAASVTFGYEGALDDVASPLAPTDGYRYVALGAEYDIGNIVLSGGARYTWIGDADVGPRDTDVGDFADNSALSLGLNVAYRF